MELDIINSCSLNHAVHMDILDTDVEDGLCYRSAVHIFHKCGLSWCSDLYCICNCPNCLCRKEEQQGERILSCYSYHIIDHRKHSVLQYCGT